VNKVVYSTVTSAGQPSMKFTRPNIAYYFALSRQNIALCRWLLKVRNTLPVFTGREHGCSIWRPCFW